MKERRVVIRMTEQDYTTFCDALAQHRESPIHVRKRRQIDQTLRKLQGAWWQALNGEDFK